MIKYILKCSNNHEFESWFSNSVEFDKLNAKKMLECIYCPSKKINKSIMAPSISGAKQKKEKDNLLDKKLLDERKQLSKLKYYIENNFEFVGDKFSEKVREIYYDNKTSKSIYGTTTQEEREILEDEGIDLLSIPWVSKDN
jgi:hypothetical protein